MPTIFRADERTRVTTSITLPVRLHSLLRELAHELACAGRARRSSISAIVERLVLAEEALLRKELRALQPQRGRFSRPSGRRNARG